MKRLPTNAIIAIAASLAIFPALYLVEWATQPCGDGLCGFFPGIFALSALFIATIVFTVRGLRREETPRTIFVVPWLIWALTAVPRFI